jgi:hypothetical protein
MNDEPVFFTLCDADDSRVEPLKLSLQGNTRILTTYCPRLKNLSKIFKIQEFLASTIDIPDDAVIVFTDAHDVLCLRYDPVGLVADFKATGQDLITGAETVFCHHRGEVLSFFLDRYTGRPAKYLNSGFIIAYKWAYLRMLNHIIDNFVDIYMIRHRYSDQRALSKFMVENAKLNLLNMDIDSNLQFCYTHTYDNNPLDRDRLKGYFVHVTWLALEIQQKAYREIRNLFNI